LYAPAYTCHKYWGVKNLGHKYWGGKNLGKIYFQTKNLEKNPFLFSKISEDLSLVIDNFFTKFTPFIQNVLPFLCIFLSLFLLSFMLIFFKYKKLKNSRLIIGGAKKGFCPHLNYWGARARAAPPESTPMIV